MSKLYISSNQYLNDSFKLADNIYKSGFEPDIVVGIWRGGSIPAITIHEYLRYRGIPALSSVIITRSYNNIGQQSEHVYIDISNKVLDNLKIADKILIVDDVLDTGKTLEEIYKFFNMNDILGKVKIASVYYKPATSSIFPDYYIHDTNKWIVFPHELEGLLPSEVKKKGLNFS
tara:strand:+ start:75 stop:596 length:522 start_codon:yes stop_codon:yes gene_type:complete